MKPTNISTVDWSISSLLNYPDWFKGFCYTAYNLPQSYKIQSSFCPQSSGAINPGAWGK